MTKMMCYATLIAMCYIIFSWIVDLIVYSIIVSYWQSTVHCSNNIIPSNDNFLYP